MLLNNFCYSLQNSLTGVDGGVALLAVQQVEPINPVHTPLPMAPNFKLYCFYGISVPTERGYHYLKTQHNGVTQWSINNMINDPESGLVRSVRAAGVAVLQLSHGCG
jgi:hypothetical protein